MRDDVLSTVSRIEELGRFRPAEFRQTRIFAQTFKLSSPIKKNKLPLFTASATKGQSKSNLIL